MNRTVIATMGALVLLTAVARSENIKTWLKNCAQIMILLLASLQVGCILPTPTGATMAPPVTGKVTTPSGVPLSDVSLERTIKEFPGYYSRRTTSLPDGTFKFPAMYVRHKYYVIGVALNFPVPNTNLLHGLDEIRATKEGFESATSSSGSVGPGLKTREARQITLRLKALSSRRLESLAPVPHPTGRRSSS